MGSVVRTGCHSSGKLKKPEPGSVTIWLGSVISPEDPSKRTPKYADQVASWLLSAVSRVGIGAVGEQGAAGAVER